MEKVSISNRPIGPFTTIIVGAYVNEKPNYVTVGAWGVVCLDPILFISLKKTHYTTQGIINSGYFSINVPHTEIVEKVDFCGIHSGKSVDKSNIFTKIDILSEKAPIIEECPINYLCKVIQQEEINGFIIFFGEIKKTYSDESCLSEGKIVENKVNSLIMFGTKYISSGNEVGVLFKSGRKIENVTSE